MEESEIVYIGHFRMYRTLRTRKIVFRRIAQMLDEWLKDGGILRADSRLDVDEIRRMIQQFRNMGKVTDRREL